MSKIVKNKRLVGVIHALNQGGAERNMVNTLNFMVRSGIEVHIVMFQKVGRFTEELDKRITIHNLQSSSVKKGFPKLLTLLYKLKPDVVFSGIEHINILLSVFIPFMKRLLPHTRWISRETNIVSVHKEKNDYPKLFHWLYHYSYHHFDAIIAQSNDMKEDLALHYPKSAAKTTVINNPINVEKIQKLAEEEIDFPFNSDTINLISVAALRTQKRHDLLLKTFSLLPQNYRLLIAGKGEEEESLKALAKSLNIEERVLFTGVLSNPYPYIKTADLLILTSEHEGFPNVLLEANALGTAIVAFNCIGGISEIIQQGINGFYVPFSQTQLLANKIQDAANHHWEKLEIIDLTKKRYSEEKIYFKYKKIFNLH